MLSAPAQIRTSGTTECGPCLESRPEAFFGARVQYRHEWKVVGDQSPKRLPWDLTPLTTAPHRIELRPCDIPLNGAQPAMTALYRVAVNVALKTLRCQGPITWIGSDWRWFSFCRNAVGRGEHPLGHRQPPEGETCSPAYPHSCPSD